MPHFFYNARDRAGAAVSGVVDAPSEAVAQDMIREQNLILLSLHEQKPNALLAFVKQLGNRVKIKDIVIFSRQLAVLISATVPIVRALRILAKQTESKTLQAIIANVADEVDGGSRLSAALQRHANVFDDFFVHMVRAGETTGRLDEVLVYLADQKEKDYALMSRVISSLIYPAFIIVMLFLVFIFMMIYVLPKLLDVVQSSGAALPLPTRILLAVSNAFQAYWPGMLVGVVVVTGVYIWARGNSTGRRVLDQARLRLPLLGGIFQKLYLARISRSLANLLSSGVPVNRSIEIVGDIVGSAVYKDVMQRAQRDVEAGYPLSQSFAKSTVVPPMMAQMMNIGEETGRLDQILLKLADFYVAEVDSLTGALVSLIEPAIIILLGLGALTLVSGILLPIYSITSQI